MRVRFYIEKRRGDDGELLTKQRPIFMTVAFNGNRIMISTSRKVDLRWWNPEKQRVRDEHPDANVLNNWLNDLKANANTVWKALAGLTFKPEVKDFKREFERLKPRYSGGFFDVFFLFIEEGGERWSSTTYKKVRSFYKLLKRYEGRLETPLAFGSMNEAFLQEFVTYLKGIGQGEVSIQKSVNMLVWFLNWARAEGYNIYTDYKKFYKALGKSGPTQRKILYLEWEELIALYSLTSDYTREERARDLFCFMCFSGLNFSELQALKKGDIEQERIVVRGSQRKERFVPLNKFSMEIADRYSNKFYKNNTAFPSLSMVTMNKYLLILAKKAELNRLVVGRRKHVEKVPLWSEMTAGIAVQTFIANALRLAIPSEVISSYTGILKDQRVKVLKQEIAKREMTKFNNLMDMFNSNQ